MAIIPIGIARITRRIRATTRSKIRFSASCPLFLFKISQYGRTSGVLINSGKSSHFFNPMYVMLFLIKAIRPDPIPAPIVLFSTSSSSQNPRRKMYYTVSVPQEKMKPATIPFHPPIRKPNGMNSRIFNLMSDLMLFRSSQKSPRNIGSEWTGLPIMVTFNMKQMYAAINTNLTYFTNHFSQCFAHIRHILVRKLRV